MKSRDSKQKVVAIVMPQGTDVTFGLITHELSSGLERSPKFKRELNYEVIALRQNEDKSWNLTVKDIKAGS